jgi:hypothetical protein
VKTVDDLQNISGTPYDKALPNQTSPAVRQSGRKNLWRNFRIARYALILLLFPFLHYTGFLATDADKADALQLANTFHNEMTHGDSDGIYDNADKAFQNAVSREHNEAYLASVTSQLGTPLDCTQDNVGVRFGLGSKAISAECTTRFSGGSTALEKFKWNKTGNEYQLYSYAIHVQ